MGDELNPGEVATTLLASLSVLVRRVRQVPVEGGLTMPERTALSHLARSGPTTSSALAREVQITAQSMGATLGELRARGLIERRPDPHDGRRGVMSVTDAGHQALRDKRNARAELIARALTSGEFTSAELEQLAASAPLLARLAQNI
ncbi:MarR family transcriptional regulator [Streptomyces xanthochromogenes]|uniref:MarR family winged helix-turn-helix transcriptional regulator n=1 Tax=Streptomyces xanthochromogenes TaxID=67384 RepID=UPI001675BF73|nr:MarR family winged helix-turn-helix transcriptional regulator [Streptomyces xanthochromogenes]GHB35721.1 MarR family transcriptional regulator [Streptomyces xanthochromogenes]